MSILSVIIPNRNSPFLNKTIEDVLTNAGCDVEVVVNVDEKWPEVLVDDPRVVYIHPGSPRGMRWGINSCARIAKGDYLMKTDDHCAFGKDFGKILIENHLEDNWIQIPRRYSLDAENWKINETRPFRDYMYIDFPLKGKDHDDGTHGVEWYDRQNERKDDHQYDIDDTPSLQGSCWFLTANHFKNTLGYMREEGYGQFSQEAQELGFKTWLGGGALKVNKKTYYCHLHKGRTYGRMYSIPGFDNYTIQASNWSAIHWVNNEEPGMVHPFKWFIDEKFPGMPSWPKDWENVLRKQGTLK